MAAATKGSPRGYLEPCVSADLSDSSEYFDAVVGLCAPSTAASAEAVSH